MARLRWIVLTALGLTACGDARAPLPSQTLDAQLARFPKGEMTTDFWPSGPRSDLYFPMNLHLLAPVVGRGVCVPSDVVRPDGARDTYRFGVWTYDYVRTTQDVDSNGEPRTNFKDAPENRLGLESRGECEADQRVGEWTFWHPNGKLRASGAFVDGRLSGPWRFWTSDGELDAALTGVYTADERVAPSDR